MRGQPVRVSLLLQWGERAPGRGLRGRHGCRRLGGTLWKVPSPDGCGRSCPCPSRPSSLCTGARPSGEPAAHGPASLGAPGARGGRCRRTPRRGWQRRARRPGGVQATSTGIEVQDLSDIRQGGRLVGLGHGGGLSPQTRQAETSAWKQAVTAAFQDSQGAARLPGADDHVHRVRPGQDPRHGEEGYRGGSPSAAGTQVCQGRPAARGGNPGEQLGVVLQVQEACCLSGRWRPEAATEP